MSEILNPNNFWNLAFVAGVLMIIMSATKISIPVPWGKKEVVLPRVPEDKQRLFWGLGTFLIFAAILMLGLSQWGGVISPKSFGSRGGDQGGQAVLTLGVGGSVLAADVESEPIIQFSLAQKRVEVIKQGPLSGLGIYVGDIHLFRRSGLLIFDSKNELISTDREYTDKEIREHLDAGEMLADREVKSDWLSRGAKVPFTFRGEDHLIVIWFRWYLIGEDLAEITIHRNDDRE